MRGVLLALLVVLAGCAARQASPSNPQPVYDPCDGTDLLLSVAAEQCLVEDGGQPQIVVDPAALRLDIEPHPRAAGELMTVDVVAVNVTDAPLEVHLPFYSKEPLASVVLVGADGFRPDNEWDETCAGLPPAGGLGMRDRGRATLGQVRLAPGGRIAWVTELMTRRTRCVCGPPPGYEGVTCTAGAGEPLPAGEWQVSTTFPIAVTRTDGGGRYTHLWRRAPVQLP